MGAAARQPQLRLGERLRDDFVHLAGAAAGRQGDREVIMYGQLAQEWVGPPGDGRHGQLHDADTIFAMSFTVPLPR